MVASVKRAVFQDTVHSSCILFINGIHLSENSKPEYNEKITKLIKNSKKKRRSEEKQKSNK